MESNLESKMSISVMPGGINNVMKGIDYQMKIMLLTIIKSYQNLNNSDFKISTEIKETEPFDDIIMEANGKSLRFIQCKFKQNSKILSFQDFVDKKNRSFYLLKYFFGFINIKKNFKNSENVVVCTNNLIQNSHSDRVVLSDTAGVISFVKCADYDEVFGNFSERYQLDRNCVKTREAIKRILIQDAKKFNLNKLVDENLDDFLSNMLFVFDLKKEDIDREIDEFIQNYFNLSVVDSLREVFIWTLCDWIENNANFFTKRNFVQFLNETKSRRFLVPKVIERSSALFQSKKFTFKVPKIVSDYIKIINQGSNHQLFYMQMEEDDTFYGSCMIYQELNEKISDEFLFLSTNCPYDIEDGLNVFSMKNCFHFLVFLETRIKPIQHNHKNLIKDTLQKNQRKRTLIITDQMKTQFAADIIGNDENLRTVPRVKLSDLNQQSLNSFLEAKKLKFQDEDIKLKNVLDSSDQNLFDLIMLKDLENIKSISHNVIAGKNFDPELYIERKMLHRKVIKRKILSHIDSFGKREKLAFDENSFDNSCKEFPNANVHLLEHQTPENDFVWKKSRGQIDFLLNYVDAEQGTSVNDFRSSEKATGEVCVLVDVAGMGKTSWMNHLAQELKKKYKDHFIVNVSFNDHTKYFQDHKVKDEESVLKFLECEVLKLRSDFEKRLFREACTKTGKVQIILDGLDEMCPESEMEMLKIIELVKKMQVRETYVSTRPELGKALAKTMQHFSYEFQPFSIEDQVNFLVKYWSRDRRVNLSDDELRTVAEKIALSVKKTELSKIAGIPLITKMLGDIFDSDLISEAIKNDSIVEDKTSNLSKLYEIFVDKKIERYLTEKLAFDLSRPINRKFAEREKLKLISFYEKMALKLILPQHLSLFVEHFDFTSDEIEEMRKCGLIFSDFDSKFIHRSIADYFIYLKLQKELKNEEIADLLIREIFCDDNFVVIRSFLNNTIGNFNGNFDVYAKILAECKEERMKAIELASKEKNENILAFISRSSSQM